MTTHTTTVGSRLRDSRIGIALALLTILFGFGMGGVFGAFEEPLKADLAARAEAVSSTVYGGDTNKIKGVLDKSWVYYQRAHLHGGAIGTAALALLAMLALLAKPRPWMRRYAAMALGLGGLGYSLYWFMAARAAPGLGSTGAAKASLEWLAVPSAGLLMLGLFSVLVMVVVELFGRPHADADKS
jgi:hypothetical protein